MRIVHIFAPHDLSLCGRTKLTRAINAMFMKREVLENRLDSQGRESRNQ